MTIIGHIRAMPPGSFEYLARQLTALKYCRQGCTAVFSSNITSDYAG